MNLRRAINRLREAVADRVDCSGDVGNSRFAEAFSCSAIFDKGKARVRRYSTLHGEENIVLRYKRKADIAKAFEKWVGDTVARYVAYVGGRTVSRVEVRNLDDIAFTLTARYVGKAYTWSDVPDSSRSDLAWERIKKEYEDKVKKGKHFKDPNKDYNSVMSAMQRAALEVTTVAKIRTALAEKDIFVPLSVRGSFVHKEEIEDLIRDAAESLLHTRDRWKNLNPKRFSLLPATFPVTKLRRQIGITLPQYLSGMDYDLEPEEWEKKLVADLG